MTSVPIPLSYMVRESQYGLATDTLGKWWTAICGQQTYDQGLALDKTVWKKTNQQFASNDPGVYNVWIGFDHQGFDPALSTWDYGPEQILTDDLAPVPGSSYLFDDTQHDRPLQVDLKAAVDYHQERSTETDTEISIDIGSKTTGTIGGDAEGAKLEEEVSVSLGIKTDKKQAESESKDNLREQDVQTEVAEGEATHALVESPDVQSRTPFSINGVWLSPLSFHFSAASTNYTKLDGNQALSNLCRDTDRATLQGTYWNLKFTSWDDFLSTIGGKNVDFPHVNSPIGPDWLIGRLADPQYRRLSWHGIQTRAYQQSGVYVYRDVTGQDLDALAKKYGIDDAHRITR